MLNEVESTPARARADTMSRAVDIAYRHIRRAIVVGELPSGHLLPEAKLAEQIGVSRTPVREALGRLANEGLVVLERYRRAYVADFSLKDFAEIFRLRANLEGEAAGRAALRMTPADLDRLGAIETEMEALFDRLGWHAHLEGFDMLNRKFHMEIARAADSPRLLLILASSLELPASIFNRYSEPLENRTRRTHVQHREVMAALRTHNAAWAEAAMRAHLFSLVVTQDGPSISGSEQAGRPAQD
jgi:DNA-binding GntR family transcriptional regulator